jgi:hypothetical protein
MESINDLIGEANKTIDGIDGVTNFFVQAAYAHGERRAVHFSGESAAANGDVIENFFHTRWDTEA